MRMIATEDRLDMGVAARVRSFQSIGAPWDAIAFWLFRAGERGKTRFPGGHCRSPPTWVGGVVVGRVVGWVLWVAGCLVQLAARAPKL